MTSPGDLTVQALNGETVDELVWRTLRLTSPAVEHVLETNPHLADADTFLRHGERVTIPDQARHPQTAPMTQLWT